MKIHCSKEEISRGIQTIQSALSPRTTLPILLNFLMETEDSKVKMVSTNLEMGVKRYVHAGVESDGSVTIPAKKFAEILHSFPEGSELEINVDTNSKVHIKCGKSRFWIIGTPKSEYPVLPEFNEAGAFQVPCESLADMVTKTIYAASTDETRYVLNGVLWVGKDQKLELVTTDGRRLALARKNILPPGKDFKVIVPTKVLQELLKVIGSRGSQEEPGSLIVAITENQIGFQLENITLLSRLVDGTFPDYQHVIPARKDIEVNAPTKEILAVTRRAALCASDRGGSVRYLFKKGVLHVSAVSQNIEFQDEMTVDYSGEDFEVAFNAAFLTDALRNVDAENVSLGLTTPVSPVVVQPVGDDSYRCVIMPIKL